MVTGPKERAEKACRPCRARRRGHQGRA
jgi:hypothetical protein